MTSYFREFRRFCCIAVSLIFMGGCGGPAPAPVDSYQITVSQENISSTEVVGGFYLVSGGAGSVLATSTVTVTNTTNPAEVTVSPASDGSFTARIAALGGDRLSIVVKDQAGVSSIATIVYVGLLNIRNPYMTGGYWYTGQTHFHTNYTDGKNTAVQMEAAYHDRGYDFLVSTDHRGTAPWYVLPIHGNTPDPDNSAAGKNLLWISGTELGFGDVHMGAWGASPLPSLEYTGIQDKIDEVRRNGGLIAINHPHNDDPVTEWDWGTETRTAKRFSFVEAFNGKHVSGKNGWVGEKNHLPTAIDLADEFQQVWWIGTDDCHDKDDPRQFDRYAVVVQTDSNVINQNDLLDFADMGSLYIRQTGRGPVLASVTTEGNKITVTMDDVDSNYNIYWRKRGNELLKSDENVNTSASYTVQGDEGYVRAEIQRVSDGLWAYIQPMFIANNTDLAMAAVVSGGGNGQVLIDNNRNTYWLAPSGTASFIVDVGRVRQINAIRIDWYHASGDVRRFNYRIETSATGAFDGEQTEVVRETYGNRSALTLDFFDETARYVKVAVTSQSAGSGGAVRISEVQVFDSSPARTNLYLDNVAGDDNNSGLSTDAPWKTFGHARDLVRPRDTLNFIPTAIPYTGGMQLFDWHSGRHPNATVRFQGYRFPDSPDSLTEIDATGYSSAVSFNQAKYLEWRYFDMRSATSANVVTNAGVTDLAIQYNRLRDSRGRGFLGGGKFTLAYNLVYRNATEGAFIYLSDTDAKIYNNVFHGNGSDGLAITNQSALAENLKASIHNNISAANAGASFRRGAVGDILDAYNCLSGLYVGVWSLDHTIMADPLFLAPQNGDFRLQPGSPCIDAGIDLNQNYDFAGKAPRDEPSVSNTGSPGEYTREFIDIGAYEFGY